MSEVTTGEVDSPTAVPIGTAASLLQVSVDTVRRWEGEGKIKATRTLGGQRRFSMAEIERVKNGGDPE